MRVKTKKVREGLYRTEDGRFRIKRIGNRSAMSWELSDRTMPTSLEAKGYNRKSFPSKKKAIVEINRILSDEATKRTLRKLEERGPDPAQAERSARIRERLEGCPASPAADFDEIAAQARKIDCRSFRLFSDEAQIGRAGRHYRGEPAIVVSTEEAGTIDEAGGFVAEGHIEMIDAVRVRKNGGGILSRAMPPGSLIVKLKGRILRYKAPARRTR